MFFMLKKIVFLGKLISMTPTNDLFCLIKKLSPNEKRYFSIWSSKHIVGKKNNYLKLFEDIDHYATINEDYDEKLFLKKFKAKPYCKNFAYNKNYLFEQVMQAMRAYTKTDTDIVQTIFDLLRDIQFYKEKKLLSLWEKTIEKANLLAVKHEKHHLKILIENEQYFYNVENNQHLLKKMLDTLFAQREKDIQRLVDAQNIKTVRYWFFLLMRIYGQENLPAETAAQMHNYIKSPLIKEYTLGKSTMDDEDYLQIMYCYYFVQKDYESCNFYLKKLYEMFVYINEYSNMYSKINSTSNYLNSLMYLNKWEDVKSILSELKKFVAVTENDKAELFQNEVFYEQLYLLNTGKLQEASMMEDKIRNGLNKYFNNIPPARKVTMLYNLSVSNFIMNNIAKAKELLEELSEDKSTARKDVKIFAKLLLLITLFELKEYEKLENTIRSISRGKEATEYKNHGSYFIVEMINELLKCIKDNKKTLAVYNTYINHPHINKNIEVLCWVKSKIEKKKSEDIYLAVL